MGERIISAEGRIIKHFPKIVDEEDEKCRNNQKFRHVIPILEHREPAEDIQKNHTEKPVEKE